MQYGMTAAHCPRPKTDQWDKTEFVTLYYCSIQPHWQAQAEAHWHWQRLTASAAA